jgi:hypothetical protein
MERLAISFSEYAALFDGSVGTTQLNVMRVVDEAGEAATG